jgi:DNA-binding transcriptional regulator YhcF (GntR family)
LGVAVKLPTVRQLAGELGLAVNTVARAYRELEVAGLVETRGRQGTFVAGPPSQTRQLAAAAAQTFLRRMRELGFEPAEALVVVRHEAEKA